MIAFTMQLSAQAEKRRPVPSLQSAPRKDWLCLPEVQPWSSLLVNQHNGVQFLHIDRRKKCIPCYTRRLIHGLVSYIRSLFEYGKSPVPRHFFHACHFSHHIYGSFHKRSDGQDTVLPRIPAQSMIGAYRSSVRRLDARCWEKYKVAYKVARVLSIPCNESSNRTFQIYLRNIYRKAHALAGRRIIW